MSEKVILNPFTGQLQKIIDESSLATAEQISNMQNDLVNLGFRTAINGDYSEFSMSGKTIDEYVDENGIDLPTSTNESYDAGNELYQPASSLDSFTKLMLHLDGVDGDTTTTDDSQSSHAITFNGNAELDDIYKKFGATSVFLEGTNSYLSTPDSNDWDFGSGDFVIEMQMRLTTTGKNHCLISAGDASTFWRIIWTPSSGGIIQFNNAIGGAFQSNMVWAFGTPPVNTWTHVAIVRDGTNLLAFKNGVQLSVSGSPSQIGGNLVTNGTGQLEVGRVVGLASEYLQGYLDEIRISKGTDRGWTSSFTPPTEPYSGAISDMTLVSKAWTADSVPSTMRLVLREEDGDSIILNTDLTAEVSRNDGTNWTAVTLAVENQFDSSSRILNGTADVSSQPSGTALKYRIKTLNNKALKIHATSRLWS